MHNTQRTTTNENEMIENVLSIIGYLSVVAIGYMYIIFVFVCCNVGRKLADYKKKNRINA